MREPDQSEDSIEIHRAESVGAPPPQRRSIWVAAALAGPRDLVVVILLLAGFFDGISGNPIHALVLGGVAVALSLDAGRRRVAEADAAEALPPERSSPEAGIASAAPAETDQRPARAAAIRARSAFGLVAVSLVGVYAFVVGGFTRYSWPATALVVIPCAVVVGIAWRGSLRPLSDPGQMDPAGAFAWAAVFVAGGLWELSALLLQPDITVDSYAHPTLSALSDSALASHAGRSIGLFVWVAVGWFLLER
jgi:hypothetical protein